MKLLSLINININQNQNHEYRINHFDFHGYTKRYGNRLAYRGQKRKLRPPMTVMPGMGKP